MTAKERSSEDMSGVDAPLPPAASVTALPDGAADAAEQARPAAYTDTAAHVGAAVHTPPASLADAASRNMLWILPLCALLVSGLLSLTHHSGPACLSRTLLHVPCPGCGLTRSFDAVWHGHWIAAFRFHPLGLPLFGLFAVYGLCALLRTRIAPARALYERWTQAANAPRVWKVALGLLFGVWGARMALMLAGNHFFWW